MANWIGYSVSVKCGEQLGYYQGTIVDADGATLTLTKAFRNGFPCPDQVTLKATDIRELKIIEEPTEVQQTHSTVSVTKSTKKTPRNAACDSLQNNGSTTGSGSKVGTGVACVGGGATRVGGSGPARSKPIDIQPRQHKNNGSGGFGASSTPKSRGGGGGGGGVGGGVGGGGARRRNDRDLAATDASDPALALDFDFETNLALFDKQALRRRLLGSKPDVVRQAEDGGGNLRHDENVLAGARDASAVAEVRLPDDGRAGVEFVTDDGARVPAWTPALRRRVWRRLEADGLLDESLLLLARALADLALRLVGGGRRLEPRNAHQAPTVALLPAARLEDAALLAAGRLLLSHGVRCAALAPPEAPERLRRARAAFRRAGGAEAAAVAELPAPDLVLAGGAAAGAGAGPWAARARCALVALEPGAAEEAAWKGARASVAGVLPSAAAAGGALGRAYVANVAPPAASLRALGVHYPPLFLAATLLPLHPAP